MTLPPSTAPAPRPATDGRRAAASRLRAHAAALRSHAQRLRASAAAVRWSGPEATAFRQEVEQLAGRCSVAAQALTHSATRLDPS
ncbi:hypothetical protein ACFY12_31825 [Streptomyces sp. NPDC001339]|uniref:hypothetical protein n=1 Tax=Streptomyces sp. NPDC001339 TaxID=3364563 RepID=UPI0036C5F556